MAFNQEVYDFVARNLSNPQLIADKMAEYGVDVSTLSGYIGIPESDINAYFSNAGISFGPKTISMPDMGSITTAQEEAERLLAQEQEAQAAADQAARDAAIREEAQRSETARLAAEQAEREEADRQEAARIEAARLEAEKTERDRIEAERAQQEAERKEALRQEALNNAVRAAIQNGFTVDELRAIAKDMGLPESMVDQAFTTMVGPKANADIIKEVTALAGGKPIGFDKIVEYADKAKLPYATVADALKSTFKDTTSQQIVDAMVYEKDRQEFSAIGRDITQDGKTVRVVDLGDAIATAIKQGIDPANLAKFYGKTEAEFKTLVNTNLTQIADTVRRAGIDSAQGLSDLLGIDKGLTSTAIKDLDIKTGLSRLTDSKGAIPLDKALEYAAQNKLSNDQLASYLGIKPDVITKYQTDTAITTGLNRLADDKGQVAFDKAIQFATDNNLTIDQLAGYLGIEPGQITQYQTDTRVRSGLDVAAGEDKQLNYDEIIKFAADNKMDLSEVVNYIGTPESRKDLLSGIQSYVTAKEADAKLTGPERLASQLNQITKDGTAAGVWDKNQGWAHHSEKMVDYLSGYGITDLNQVGTRIETRNLPPTGQVTPGEDFRATEGEQAANYVVYYDKVTGKELQAVPQSDNGGMWRFGSEGEGKGSTGYFLGPTQGGGAGITSNWEEKYGAKEYALPLALAAAFAAPYLLPELIGGAVGGVELAALGGEMTAGTGLTGMLMSAGVPAAIAAPTATAIVRGTYQGLVNEAAGGDFAKGFISGGVAPALGQMATNYTYYNLPEELSNSQAVIVSRAVGNAVTQLITNGELNVTQMLSASITPAAIDAVVKASDGALTNAQAKLLVQTVLSGGQNITAMAQNPMAVMNFVQNNSKLIDEIASGTSNTLTTNRITLSGLTDDQQRSLADVSEPGSDISQLASVTVTAGSDTAIGADAMDVIPSGSTTTPAGSVTVTAPSTPIGDQLTVDTVTPGLGLGSSNVITSAPSVTVTAPKDTGVLDEALKIDTILPGSLDTIKAEPVVVTSKSILDEKLKNDVVTTEPVVVTSTPIVTTDPVTVTSTKLNEDVKTEPVVVTSTKLDDVIKAEPVVVTSTKLDDTIKTEPVVVKSTPLIDEVLKTDVVTTTPPVTTTTSPTTTTAPTITIPPIVLDPGITVKTPVGVTTTTSDDTMVYQYPTVGGPELPTYYGMPYPNYLRPLDPYLPMGLAALMEAMYGQVSRDGNYQSLQNAGAQVKVPA